MIDDAVVEEAIRDELGKPEGELTEADFEKVKMLALTSTKITDAGLQEAAKLKSFSTFYLWDTQITDMGLKEVAELKQLEVFRCEEPKVTKEGVPQLQEALSNCFIDHDYE